jgi:hypothetical protein
LASAIISSVVGIFGRFGKAVFGVTSGAIPNGAIPGEAIMGDAIPGTLYRGGARGILDWKTGMGPGDMIILDGATN